MSRVHESGGIAHDVQHLSARELQDLYGIQFIEDPDSKSGRVFDPVLNKEFAKLSDWVAEQVQQEEWSGMAHETTNARPFDDEYY